MTSTKIINVEVTCGDSEMIDAYDNQGNPVRYQVVCEAATASGGAGGAAPAPSDPVLIPPGQGPVAAMIMVMDPSLAGLMPGPDADIYLSQRLVGQLPAGTRVNAILWTPPSEGPADPAQGFRGDDPAHQAIRLIIDVGDSS